MRARCTTLSVAALAGLLLTPSPLLQARPAARGYRAAPPPEVLAIIAEVEGEAWIAPPGSRPAGTPARPLMPLLPETLLRLAPGARLSLICRSNTAFVLHTTERLRPPLCDRGAPLPEGSFAAIRPDGGQLRVVGQSFEILADVRGGEEGLRPVLLAPRNTWIADGRPTLLWTAVTGATHYQIEISGSPLPAVTLEATPELCRQGQLAGQGAEICRWEWPPEGPALLAGRRYFPILRAWHAEGGGWIEESLLRSSEIRVLGEDEARKLAEARGQLAASGLPSSARHLLAASLLAEKGLRAEALAEVGQLFPPQAPHPPVPEVVVTVGELLRASDLGYRAAAVFRQILENEEDPSLARAAAELGLGRVHAGWNDPESALPHLEAAERAYTELGDLRHAGIAECEASRSRARLLQP